MGLISGLLTWPLAPVRCVGWIAEQVLEEAERQWADPEVVERALLEVDEKLAAGELSPEEAAEMEEALVARLVRHHGDGHG
jgi:gas vesicle protein GvpG